MDNFIKYNDVINSYINAGEVLSVDGWTKWIKKEAADYNESITDNEINFIIDILDKNNLVMWEA